MKSPIITWVYSLFVLFILLCISSCKNESKTLPLLPSFNNSIDDNKVSAPQFNLQSGSYSSDINIVITSPTEGSTIYYTLDGTDPSEFSTEYAEPISISGDGSSSIITAIATHPDKDNSNISSASYTINYLRVSTPNFSPSTVIVNDNHIDVTINCSTSGAAIYYTTNGDDPTILSNKYTDTFILTGRGIPYTLKAIAVKSGMKNSTIGSVYYQMNKYPTASFSPYDLEDEVPVDSNITITFSEPMNATGWSVNVNGLVYNDSSDRISWNEDILTIDPIPNFPQGETVNVILSNFKAQVDDYEFNDTFSFIAGWPWNITTIGRSSRSSIGIDYSDNVYIGWSDYDSSEFKYYTNSSGSWVINTPGITGDEMDMVLESNGYLHFSYANNNFYNLCHSSNVSGGWVEETSLDIIHDTYKYLTMAISNDDKIYIYYNGFVSPNGVNFRYITNETGSWVTHIIQDTPCMKPDISIDSSHKIHICYYYGSCFYYMTNKTGTWESTILDTLINSGYEWGFNKSIAIDSNDNVHISYYQGEATFPDRCYLKYATNANGNWETIIVDSGDVIFGTHVGRTSSIITDNNNKVHISYEAGKGNWDGDTDKLKYATNKSGEWRKTVVDTSLAQFPSIAIDSSGNIHISYFVLGYNIKYATTR